MLKNKMLNALSMNEQECPICGFSDATVLDDFNCPTFEICACCGSELGLEFDLYSTPEHLAKIRCKWVNQDNCKWWGNKKLILPNWGPKKQMELANIEIPQ